MKPRETLWVLLLLAAVPILFFHESLFTDRVLSQADFLLAFSPWQILAPANFQPSNWLLMDQTFQFFPWLSFARDEIQKGTLPLWNPYSYSGSPLLANGQSAIFSPFHLLFYVFPFLKMFAVSACLRLFLTGLFTYLFLKSLGISSLGSLLSALSYQTCGFLIVLLNHPHSQTASLLPLLFWLTERLCRGPSPKRIALLSFAFFLQCLSGHMVTALIQTLVVFTYGLYRSKGSFVTVRSLVFATFLGASTSAIVLLPTFEYAMLSHARTYRLTEYVSPFPQKEDLKAMLTIFFPMLYGSPIYHNSVGPRNFNQLNQGFTGGVVLVFALFALCTKGRTKNVGFFLGLLLIGLGAAYHFPPLATLLDKIRLLRIFWPTSWLLFTAFSFSILAGIGLDALFSGGEEASKFLPLLLAFLIGIGLCGASIALTHQIFFPEISLEMLTQSFSTVTAVLGVLLILYLSWSKNFLHPVCLKGGILFLVVFEHFLFGFRFNPTVRPRDIFQTTPGIQFLQSDPDPAPFRILSLKRVFTPNTSMMYHLQEVRGYDALEYHPYLHYLARVGTFPFLSSFFSLHIFPYYDSPLIDLLNVKYILSDQNLSGDFLRLVYNGEVKIYQNLRMFPRVHLFGAHEVIRDPEEQLNRLARVMYSNELRKTVFLREPLPPLGQTAKRWEAHWVLYEPSRFVLDVASDGSGILFLSEIDYPGWKAYLDGERTKIYRANYLFRSIVFPKGNHQVEMRYEPESFRWGMVVSGLSFLFLVFLFFLP